MDSGCYLGKLDGILHVLGMTPITSNSYFQKQLNQLLPTSLDLCINRGLILGPFAL